jgi:hypothetical protein
LRIPILRISEKGENLMERKEIEIRVKMMIEQEMVDELMLVHECEDLDDLAEVIKQDLEDEGNVDQYVEDLWNC